MQMQILVFCEGAGEDAKYQNQNQNHRTRIRNMKIASESQRQGALEIQRHKDAGGYEGRSGDRDRGWCC